MRIGIDIETTLDHKTIHVVKTIDLDTGEVKTWYEASPLKAYLEGCTLLVAHNGIGFDFRMLKKLWGMKTTTATYDTLVVSRLLDPSRESGHSLASWGEALGTPKVDYEATWCWMMDRRQAYDGECYDAPIMPLLDHYCEQDVRVLRVLFLHLEAEVKRLGFSQQSLDLEHEVADIIAQQIDNGFKLDVQRATLLLTELKGRMAEIYEQMQLKWPPYTVERYSTKVPGRRLQDGVVTFNPGSRTQVAEKLLSLGWKPTKFTPTGRPQIDESTLAGVDIPEAKPIVDYFTLQKLVGFVESWFKYMDKNCRVHGDVITNGAQTGRMTHSSPNVAQTPKIQKDKNKQILMGLAGGYGFECRSCWTAEDGMVLVGCDASSLELRMLASYMGDDAYTEAVVHGDVHTMNQQAAGIDTRDNAKTFIYAYLYGAGDEKIGSIVKGTAKDGKRLKAQFLAKTPALKKLKERLQKSFERGYCVGLDGRRIWLASEHSALNYLLQGAGAIVMKQALVLCNRKLAEQQIRYKFTANVHDEWQIETTPEYAELVGQIARESIIQAGVVLGLKCPLDGEFKVGKTWADTH